MIDYVEIRDTSRKVIGIIDTAQSIIWKSVYYGVGEFEIYVAATPTTLSLLQLDYYVTRLDNDECGIIEHIEITDEASEGKMIVASGRFLKSILERRIVMNCHVGGSGSAYMWYNIPTTLSGNLETEVRRLVSNNTVNISTNYLYPRRIPELNMTDDDITGLDIVISSTNDSGASVDASKQVSYDNLLNYTDSVLQEYSCGAKMWLDLDDEQLRFRYKIYQGADRSRDSTTHQPLIFSKEFDNLTSLTYVLDNTTKKTTAFVGGEDTGSSRKFAFANAYGDLGLNRREVFVDASDLTTDGETGLEELTDYRQQLETKGYQTLATTLITETMEGKVDLTNSRLIYGKDYSLGDLITIEDKELNKYINSRILSVTEVQDDKGYSIEIEFGA